MGPLRGGGCNKPVSTEKRILMNEERGNSGTNPELSDLTLPGFRELSIPMHTGIWRRIVEMARAFGRTPALLVVSNIR